jgi:hypothetical protein
LKGCTAARKLGLTRETCKKRVQWCQQHRQWNEQQWQRVIFSDECRVGFQSDGRVSVWRRTGERGHPDCITTKGTSRHSVMFWSAVSHDGVLPLQECPQRMNAQHYIHTLEAAGVSATPSFGLLFMDDNAPIHRAAVVNEWMENYGISRLMWPPYSPDISPIENLWAYLKRHLLELRPQPTNMEDLLEKCHTIWNNIPKNIVHGLYNSMPTRIRMCLKNKGYPINY